MILEFIDFQDLIRVVPILVEIVDVRDHETAKGHLLRSSGNCRLDVPPVLIEWLGAHWPVNQSSMRFPQLVNRFKNVYKIIIRIIILPLLKSIIPISLLLFA